MSTARLFRVTITDPKTHGRPIELPVLRSGIEVARLKLHYEKVDAVLAEKPEIPPADSRLFADAVRALVVLYRSAERWHDHDLASRAEGAVKVLLGKQKFLRLDDDFQSEAITEPRGPTTENGGFTKDLAYGDRTLVGLGTGVRR
jgi:hypothetical protein